MKDFKTAALPVILVQPTCPGARRAKGVQFQSTCNLCRESHKTQVWLCFLLLSFLSTSACAAPTPTPDPDPDPEQIKEVKICLNKLKPAIEKSDAMLYAPSVDVEGKCNVMSLRCYMLELIMIIEEEEIMDKKVQTIYDFNFDELPTEANSVGCPPCETYPLQNATEFLERLNTLLQAVTTVRT